MTTIDFPNRNLRLINTGDIIPGGRPWLMVHSVRTAFLICILFISVVYQVQLGNFLNTEIWLPVYAILSANFLFNAFYLFTFDETKRQDVWNAVLFGLDTISITLLIYFTGTSQSLFLFLYLVNLILGSLVFDKEGAWLLAIWTSICFSALLIFSPGITGQSLYFSLSVNNIAFAAVTYLGGRLAEQVIQVGTRLQETQSDLLTLQNLNELIVNNITTGIVVLSRTGFVQHYNARAAEVLGMNHFQQVKLNDVIPQLDWPWRALIENEGLAFERREVKIKGTGEQVKILEVVAARLKDGDGKLKGWLLLFDDRTEQKMMEAAFRQQEKLAAVGQLAAGIAHEIRNPLASISGSIQLMLASPNQQTEENLKLMRIVDKEIDRLNRLIGDFLNYVRPETKSEERVNLNNLIREVLESVKFNPKLRQEVRQEVSLKAAADVEGNRDKLKQAILNLVINAYQAMENTNRPVLDVKTVDQNDLVVMVIRDNGCGIKKENLERIFEPFHTTKPQGTGLGLAVTHKIFEAHGARVLVDSVEGEYTQFIVEFPAFRDIHTEDLNKLRREVSG